MPKNIFAIETSLRFKMSLRAFTNKGNKKNRALTREQHKKRRGLFEPVNVFIVCSGEGKNISPQAPLTARRDIRHSRVYTLQVILFEVLTYPLSYIPTFLSMGLMDS
jgi:hypothetical protein